MPRYATDQKLQRILSHSINPEVLRRSLRPVSWGFARLLHLYVGEKNMNHKPIFIVILVLALVTMACGINIDLPQEVKTGPTQTDEISVPLPEDTQVVTDLTISFAGGDLELAPGAEDALASGTATYNVA